jgi:hypothetical protein
MEGSGGSGPSNLFYRMFILECITEPGRHGGFLSNVQSLFSDAVIAVLKFNANTDRLWEKLLLGLKGYRRLSIGGSE